MKITDSEVIKTCEQELIDAITADLDWEALENIFRKEHGLGIDEDVEYKRGDIVVHQGQVAYQLDFEVKVTLSVLLDRDGNYLSVSTSRDTSMKRDEEQAPPSRESQDEKGEGEESTDQINESKPEEEDPDRSDVSSTHDEESPEEKITQSASKAGEMINEWEE
ncbi:MAG: hypothetical protein JRH13_14475 [Deltaproteobacteria bacterium]|nr:hypothetical protein [Deltaproteobacteria bacterium]MBW2015864.1 hypothetical protein [Deltaproteobacteria bacterium]MBW2130556.1 hypothetical protein [Deltaproteobacteria bacterium]MBW2303959.1 hypothetical protein [Deltaproteobacteria bacterium]